MSALEFPAMLAAFAVLGALVHAAGVAAGRRGRRRFVRDPRLRSTMRRVGRLSERVEELELARIEAVPLPLVHFEHFCLRRSVGDALMARPEQDKTFSFPDGYEPCPVCTGKRATLSEQ